MPRGKLKKKKYGKKIIFIHIYTRGNYKIINFDFFQNHHFCLCGSPISFQ